MGDWITDVVGDIKSGVKEAEILKKYNLGGDPSILKEIRGYNYLRTSDSEDAARTAYPTIFNINSERNKPKPVPVTPTKQEVDLANQMKGLKEMSKVNRATDNAADNKLKPIAEDIDLMSKKAALDKQLDEWFNSTNFGKTQKAIKERKAKEEEINVKVNTAISSARAEVDPAYAMYQQIVAPIFSTAQKASGDISAGLIRNLGNVAEFITGDEGISEAAGQKADNVKAWWRRNQSENAAKRAGGAFLTEPIKQQGGIFNDGKVNAAAIVPRTVETLTNMAYLLGGAGAMGGGSVGLMASGYLNTFEGGREDALNAGLNSEQADAFAGINSTIQAALELISPNDVVFGKVKSKVTGEILKRITDKTSRSQIFKEVAGAYAKEIGAENLQELTQTAAEKGLKWLYNKAETGADFQDTGITKDEILETVLLTTLATGAMSTPGIMSEARPSKMKVGAYVTASENLENFTNLLQSRIEDGSIAEEDAGRIYGEVETFAKLYAENKAAGYSEDQAARLAWNDRTKARLDQIPQQVQGNPTLQATVTKAVQEGQKELDSDTQDAKMGIPKQGEVITGDKLAEIMGQIPDKGKPITEARALEFAKKDYSMGMVNLDELYESNKKFAGLVDQYKESINPTKAAEGETKKEVDPEIKARIKNSNPQDMRMPAVVDGTKVIDGMHRLAQQYVNGMEYARAFQAMEDITITNKTESDGKRQEEGQEDVLVSTPPKTESVKPATIAEKSPASDNPARQTFKGKTHNVKYDEKGIRIVVAKNGKPINPESPEAKKALTAHAKNYKYDVGERAPTDNAPDFGSNQDDMYAWMAENSNNPAELVSVYRSAPTKGNALSEKELAIVNRGVLVTSQSYKRFGDPNNMEAGKRLKYIRKDGLPIDTLAKEISDETGMDITPQDIITFMDTYPGGVAQALKEQEGEAQTIARQKFEKITGIPLTDQVADMAFKQYVGPEKLKEAEKKLDDDFDSISDEDITASVMQAIDEEVKNGGFDVADLEAFIAENNITNEQDSQTPSENQQQQEPEEDIRFDERADEGEDTETDLRETPEPDATEDEVNLAEDFDAFIAENAPAADIDTRLKEAKSRYDQAVYKLETASAKLAKEQGKQSDIFGTGQQAGMFAASAEDSKAVLDPLRQDVKEAKAELDELARQKSVQDNAANPDMFAEPMAKMGSNVGKLFFKEFSSNDAALDAIADALPEDADAQRAIEFIRPILAANPNVKVVPARPGEYTGRLTQAYGLSYPDGTITLNFDAIPDEETMMRTLLHEYIHAATRYEIFNNPAFKEELDTLLSDIREAMGLPDTEALIATMQGMGLIEDGKYGATNAYEMVAEVFSNPEFSNYLRGIEYKGDNLLRRIYLAIVKFFQNAYRKLEDAKTEIDATNLADYIMSLTEKIVRPNNTGQDGGVLASMKQKYPADIVKDFIRIKLKRGVNATKLRDMLVEKTGMTPEEVDAMMVQAQAERTYETPGEIRKNFVGKLEEGEKARKLPVRIAPGLDPAIRTRLSDQTKKYFQISNKQTQAEADRFMDQYDADEMYSWLLTMEAQQDLNKLPGRTKVFVYAAAVKAMNKKAKAAKMKMDFAGAKEYAQRGADLMAVIAPMGTEFGQAVQAFRVFSEIAPSLVSGMAEKIMDEVERRMRGKKKVKKDPASTPPADPNAPVPEATAPAEEEDVPAAEEPMIDPEVRRQIMELADEIDDTPEGLPRSKKVKELTRQLALLDIHNTSGLDLVQAIWYSHILAGIGTHAKNTFANLGNTLVEFMNLGLRRVIQSKDIRILPFMIRAWWDGLGKGISEAANIMATGLTKDTVEKFGQSPLFEWFTWKDYLSEGKVDWAAKKLGLSGAKIGKLLDFPAFIGISPKALRYVGRALAAADAMLYTANAEMASGAMAWQQAKILNSEDPAKDIRAMANEMMGNVKEKIEVMEKQAEAEGFTPRTREFRIRTNELMLATRAEDIVDVGDQYGAKVTFNHEPNGILAPWYRSVTQLTNAHRSVRFFMPFMRIVTNLMENYLNYTPVGLVKAVAGKRETDSKYFKKLTPDQRAELYVKFGIGLTTAMATWLLGAFDDDDDGIIEISAAGTGDYQRNYELQKSGWREYSIRVGGTAISYKDSPLFAMLAAIGTASDHYKFGNGDPNDAGIIERYNIAAMGMVSAMFDQSWMSGLDELVTATKGVDKYGRTQNFGGKAMDAGIGILRSLAMTNFTSQNIRVIREAMDEPIKRAAGIEKIYRDIPYLNDNLNPIIDVWGEPVVPEQTLSWKPYRIEFELDEDPVNDFLAKRKIWVGLPERKEVIDYNTGTAMPMTDQQYYDYTKRAGQLSKQYIRNLLAEGAFDDQSIIEIKKMIDAEKRKAREEAYYELTQN
jgi:hypothetical protein